MSNVVVNKPIISNDPLAQRPARVISNSNSKTNLQNLSLPCAASVTYWCIFKFIHFVRSVFEMPGRAYLNTFFCVFNRSTFHFPYTFKSPPIHSYFLNLLSFFSSSALFFSRSHFLNLNCIQFLKKYVGV